ncbi:hypothetical protein ACO0M4_31010 [Streptomyces sp. RGM 3693]|uniref:hypothetical protein n=1 Tax=Streptomyces sp. RGM 3693 TaxID=3413284 RepID=UPI003D2C664E
MADGAPDLLDSYEPERRAAAAKVLDVSSQLLQRHREGTEYDASDGTSLLIRPDGYIGRRQDQPRSR